MNNILLVRLPSYVDMVTPPLGIGYLLKAIRQMEGIRPVFIDCHRDKIKEDELVERIRSLRPLVVGFQIFSVDYVRLRSLVPKIRQAHPHVKIIAGGPHASGLPEYILRENPELDFVIKGEGEEALRLLILHLLEGSQEHSLQEIPNLVYRTDGEIRFNKFASIDVHKYGAPAWDLLEPDKYPPIQHGTFHKSDRVVPILTSRGCPYPCTFCAGHLLTGKKLRLRESKDIADEIEFLQSTYGFQEMIIEDENFTFYKDHVMGLSDEIFKRGIQCHFSLASGIRLDRIDEEIVCRLKRMGVYTATLGIESGSEKTLTAMKKNWDLNEVREKIQLLKRNGIIVLGSFILGYSSESMEDINQTIDFAVKCGIDTAYFGNYIPLPGTEDFNRLLDTGELKLEEIDWNKYTSYFGKLPYHPKDISEQALLQAIRRATFRFYFRPRIMFNLLKRMTNPIFLRSLIFRAMHLFK